MQQNQTQNCLCLTSSVLEGDDQLRPSVSIIGPEHRSFVVGQSVELSCSSQGLTNPRIRWRRPGNQPLPPGHSVRNGVLTIPRIEPEYAGEYICSVSSDSLTTDFTASVYIIVNGKICMCSEFEYHFMLFGNVTCHFMLTAHKTP